MNARTLTRCAALGAALLGLLPLAGACGGDAGTGAGGGQNDTARLPGDGGVQFGDGGARPDAGAGPDAGARPDGPGPADDGAPPADAPLDGGGEEPCESPGARSCVGDEVVVCGADGLVEDRIDCRPNVCLAGQCALCRPAELTCRDGAVVRCNEDSSGFTVVDDCAEEAGCINGRCAACAPGAGRCEEGTAVRCADDGSGWVEQQDCDAAGFDCVQGTCLNPCSTDPKSQTNAGCDFYALDLDNAYVVVDGTLYNARDAQFAVVVGNTSAEKSAQVTVTLPDAAATTIVRDVPPRSLETFPLPATWGLDGTVRDRRAFRVQSTRPVTVSQFNPLSNEDVFSNDASVLLPTPSLGTEYYVATLPSGVPFAGFFAIVAVEAGTTEVTIRPTAATAAGTGVPAMTRGVEHGVVLERGEVLNVEASAAGADLAGTHIRASQRVVVFGGHEAAVTGAACCADHLEEQLLPVSRWGTRYIATHSMRRLGEKDHWLLLSSVDGNRITVEGSVTGVPATLDAGVPARFQSDQDFVVTGEAPLLLVQFLASSFEILGALPATCTTAAQCPQGYECRGTCESPTCLTTAQCPSGHTCVDYVTIKVCEPIGDPAMILAVPTEQFRKEFVFLTPDSYQEDYANVVAPLGLPVSLDGSPLPPNGFTPVGASGYAVQRVPLSDGVHVVSAAEPVGLVVYGYDDDVSYGYPGGLGLEDLQQ